jgi:hypothetical protein
MTTWFHQNCDDNKDAGWGCCYRSYQNAMLLHGEQTTFSDIVDVHGSWTEPPKLRKFIPAGFDARTYLWFKRPQDLQHMKFTGPEDYDVVVHKDKLEQVFTRSAKTCSMIIDDGTYAYCLVYSRGWMLLDPHVDVSAKVSRRITSLTTFLNTRPLWMIMTIRRAPVDDDVTGRTT